MIHLFRFVLVFVGGATLLLAIVGGIIGAFVVVAAVAVFAFMFSISAFVIGPALNSPEPVDAPQPAGTPSPAEHSAHHSD